MATSTTRRAQAALNRQAHHQRRLARAATDRDALWVACAWLVAEAVRAGRAAETTAAVLRLVDALLGGRPVTVGEVEPHPDPSPTAGGGR